MFGYVRPYRPSLVTGDYEFYRSVYCGLCRAMKRKTGKLSSFSLNYDFVFLALVRMLTEEDHVRIEHHRCAVHPVKPRPMAVDHPAIDYAARVSAILVYHKLRDDIADEGFFGRIPPRTALSVFRRARRRAALPELDAHIADCLGELSRMERERVASVDAPAEVFGRLLGGVFAYGVPEEHRDTLFSLGMTVGRFIYAADAAEDFDRDAKSGSYNPYVLTWGNTLTPDAKRDIRASLLLLLADGESTFRDLPYGKTLTVRRLIGNILYDGLVHRVDFLLDPPPKTKKPVPYDGNLP